MSLNLYLVRLRKSSGIFHEALVCAENEEAAIQPPVSKKQQEMTAFQWPTDRMGNLIKRHAKATYIGSAAPTVKQGILLFHYNAG